MKQALLTLFLLTLSFSTLLAQTHHRMTGPVAKNYKKFKKFEARNTFAGVGIDHGTSKLVARKVKTFQHRARNYKTIPRRFDAKRKWFNGQKGPKAKNFKPWKN